MPYFDLKKQMQYFFYIVMTFLFLISFLWSIPFWHCFACSHPSAYDIIPRNYEIPQDMCRCPFVKKKYIVRDVQDFKKIMGFLITLALVQEKLGSFHFKKTVFQLFFILLTEQHLKKIIFQ